MIPCQLTHRPWSQQDTIRTSITALWLSCGHGPLALRPCLKPCPGWTCLVIVHQKSYAHPAAQERTAASLFLFCVVIYSYHLFLGGFLCVLSPFLTNHHPPSWYVCFIIIVVDCNSLNFTFQLGLAWKWWYFTSHSWLICVGISMIKNKLNGTHVILGLQIVTLQIRSGESFFLVCCSFGGAFLAWGFLKTALWLGIVCTDHRPLH
jgi:hypothetical protein